MAMHRATSGERDRPVVIQQLPSADRVAASRLPMEVWTHLATVWAQKDDQGGKERFAANQVSAPYDTRWSLPYRPDMDPELIDVPKQRRLIVNGRVHDIVAATEVGRKAGIELFTVAGGLLT